MIARPATLAALFGVLTVLLVAVSAQLAPCNAPSLRWFWALLFAVSCTATLTVVFLLAALSGGSP
jgi:hypothetical protein